MNLIFPSYSVVLSYNVTMQWNKSACPWPKVTFATAGTDKHRKFSRKHHLITCSTLHIEAKNFFWSEWF